MPLVRITGRYDARALRALGRTVHEALIAAIGIPPDDFFQVLAPSSEETHLVDPDYLGCRRITPVLVEITLSAGRSNDQKRALYAAITRGAETLGIRPDDVMIVLRENTRVDWSFGGGIAQYVPTG